MSRPVLEFNYDISCPFAYIASTRVEALASRTNAELIWRPVLLGAIYRATSAPQGAAGSASDLHNPTKRAVTAKSMSRTLRRYAIDYNPPPSHPPKTVNALRLLHSLSGPSRQTLTKHLFRAYWVEGRDVSDDATLLAIAKEAGITVPTDFTSQAARDALEQATADAISRGAFGVPGFWIPNARSSDGSSGRFFWGQDRMHFVEASLLSSTWSAVPNLKSLMPRSIPHNRSNKTVVEFWYDFSSPWAFLGWTQLARLQRSFPDLQIVMKPFLLGILFREIGAPNLPMGAVSATKAAWSRQDHVDWTRYWNAVNEQEGKPDREICFTWAEKFPIRTPSVLRAVLVQPDAVGALYRACWEENEDMGDESVLEKVLTRNGYDGAEVLRRANSADVKAELRKRTAEAKELGICGVPSYRVLRGGELQGGIVWGQDELNVVEDIIAGWDEGSREIAEPRKAEKNGARL